MVLARSRRIQSVIQKYHNSSSQALSVIGQQDSEWVSVQSSSPPPAVKSSSHHDHLLHWRCGQRQLFWMLQQDSSQMERLSLQTDLQGRHNRLVVEVVKIAIKTDLFFCLFPLETGNMASLDLVSKVAGIRYKVECKMRKLSEIFSWFIYVCFLWHDLGRCMSSWPSL